VDNDSQLDALLQESKYYDPRSVSPPAEARQTTRNQAGTLKQTTKHIPTNQPCSSRPTARNMPPYEPCTLKQTTRHIMPIRQTMNQANDQQQHYRRPQQIQARSKPTPSSPAKSVKPFRKAITGVAMSQQSQQIPESTFEEAESDTSQEEFPAQPYSTRRRPRTAISGITVQQLQYSL
jgi:hypothetical protein